jgi:hypothetical protein
VYYDGTLFHVGHHDDMMCCVRTFAVVTRGLAVLKRRGLLPDKDGGQRGAARAARGSAAREPGASVVAEAAPLEIKLEISQVRDRGLHSISASLYTWRRALFVGAV